MGQPITGQLRSDLDAAQAAGNRVQYYSLLADAGYDYGHLALDVVLDRGLSGGAANSYMRSVAAAKGVSMSDDDWTAFSIDLMDFFGDMFFRGHHT